MALPSFSAHWPKSFLDFQVCPAELLKIHQSLNTRTFSAQKASFPPIPHTLLMAPGSEGTLLAGCLCGVVPSG